MCTCVDKTASPYAYNFASRLFGDYETLLQKDITEALTDLSGKTYTQYLVLVH